ncbi:MAG: NAD(+)/NADH kinase [Candidatus Peregrinibacteria bacterium]
MKPFQRIGVTVKSALDHKDEAVTRVMKILRREKKTVLIDGERLSGLSCTKGCELMQGMKGIDLLIVIGGDGTVLRTVREIDDFRIPILSVNRGTVGFLAEVELNEADRILPELLSGNGMIDTRSLLKIQAIRGTKTVFRGVALNEAVIAQGTIARLIDLQTKLNGESLTTYLADGLIIATPTGSTAYSLAAGGPIVHPTFRSAMILTAINPYSFSQKPIVISGDSTVEALVHVRAKKFADVDINLTLDGQMYVPLQDGDRIRATIAPQTLRFLRRKQDTFLHTLRTKLRWGER